jgi:CBS domain-containing protein
MPLNVRAAMTPPVILSPKVGLYEAMVRVGYAPFGIVSDHGQVLGIVARTDLDLARLRHRQLVKRNPFLDDPRIEGLVRHSAILVGPETPLAEATALLHANQLPAMPVVDGHILVGVLTLRNALDQLRELGAWDREVA